MSQGDNRTHEEIFPDSPLKSQVDQNGHVLISIKEVEISKLNLQEGDVLAVTVRHDDLDAESLDSLKQQMGKIFPNNKVMVFGLGTKDGIDFSIVVSSEPKGYCGDCECGKKEQIEGAKNARTSD